MAKKRPKAANPWPQRLADLRTFYDLSQEEAAARIDAPVGTWRNWEQGRRKPNPMIIRLLQLAFSEFFARKK